MYFEVNNIERNSKHFWLSLLIRTHRSLCLCHNTCKQIPWLSFISGLYRRDGGVVRAFAPQTVDLGSFPKSSHTKKFLKMTFTASLLGVQHIGIVWRTSWQACLLCPWASHLTGRLHLHVADRWWGQTVYQSWWPS